MLLHIWVAIGYAVIIIDTNRITISAGESASISVSGTNVIKIVGDNGTKSFYYVE